MSSPSSTSRPSALAQVCRAWPYCWLRVVIEGVGDPGRYVPSAIARRRSAARRMYALGSDSSPIDTLVPYSIGKVANRNASTVVDRGRGRPKGCTLFGMYLWSLFGHDLMERPILHGITDDLAKAMRAAEPPLKDGRAFICVIEEVRMRINVTGLEENYAATGKRWNGRRNTSDGVHWRLC